MTVPRTYPAECERRRILKKHPKMALTMVIGILIGCSPPEDQKKVLRVGAGNQHIVKEQTTVVDEWVMENNSTLKFAQGIEEWTIHATSATFGSGVRILGVGTNGTAGSGASRNGRNGSKCEDGGNGTDGAAGTPGKPGVDIKIISGLVEVGSVLIDTSGGQGGNGERGGKGGRGGRASCGEVCSGQEGGNGGSGGAAGSGGSGGSVEINYWIAGKQRIVVGYAPRSDDGQAGIEPGLRVRAEPGAPGNPGQGGSGGSGGASRRCAFNTVRRGAGPNGASGPMGRSGQAGDAGDVQFSVVQPK